MTDQTEVRIPAGEIVASGVSAEAFEQHYADGHHEWVKGYVIAMSPISLGHDRLNAFLRKFIEMYLEANPIGRVVGDPFLMQVDSVAIRRQPDLQIILNNNQGQLTETAMLGPADICIEIVSPGSTATDHGDKYTEYEAAGVREYWIFDPQRRAYRFNGLGADGLYQQQALDPDGYYTTPLLPKFRLHVPTLWQDQLPTTAELLAQIQAMMGDDDE